MIDTTPETDGYAFGSYLQGLSVDWYDGDPLLHRLMERYSPGADPDSVARFGSTVAGPLRALAETSARPENAPAIRAHDPYNHRTDEIVLPSSTRESEGQAGDAGAGDRRSHLRGRSGAKPVLTALASRHLHEAMTVLDGNGIEERFSPLPRLYRDR